MKLTKVQLRQLIKEEMGLLLQEKKCRTLRKPHSAALWSLLQENSKNRALKHWKKFLADPKYCPEFDDVSDAAVELIGAISSYWRTNVPKWVGCMKKHLDPEREKPEHCKKLAALLKIEKKMLMATLKRNKLQHKNQLSYIRYFLGTMENAQVIRKYPVLPKY